MKNTDIRVEEKEEIELSNKREAIKIDIPSGLLSQLETLFADETPKTFKKILFIIYIINQGKYNSSKKSYEQFYELSRTKLKSYLSLNSKLSVILDKLISNKIIAKNEGYLYNNHYQKYKMVNFFDYKNCEKTIYLNFNDGAYVNRYIKDGYIIRYSGIIKTEDKKMLNHEISTFQKHEADKITELTHLLYKMEERIGNLEDRLENCLKNDSVFVEGVKSTKDKDDEMSSVFVERWLNDEDGIFMDLGDPTSVDKEVFQVEKREEMVFQTPYDRFTFFDMEDEFKNELTDIILKYNSDNEYINAVLLHLGYYKTISVEELKDFGVSKAVAELLKVRLDRYLSNVATD